MRFLILVSAIISTIFATESPVYRQEEWNIRDADVQPLNQFYEGVFLTRVDHFQPLNQDLIPFRYHVNANFFLTGNPLYIYIKDIGDYTTRWIERGLMVDIAQETGAALLTFDMRFFGRNRPTSDTSFENLELLTVEQSLADIARFIRFIRQYVGNGEYSPVILWGSGHGASLAVWARKRYPHLVNAVWSSSGQFALSAYSFTPFDLLEGTLLPNIAQRDCRDRVEDAYETLHELMESGDGAFISNRFNLCEPIDTDDVNDVAAFYELSVRALINYFEQYHNNGVNDFCFNMRAILADPLHSFARWIVHVYGDGSCFDHSFAGMIERSSNVEWDQYGTDTGRRQWYYLQCTQTGGFPLADRFTWIPQSVPMSYHIRKCEEIFGPQYNSTTLVSAIDNLYAEFSESIQNVIYTNGNIDPWRYFGRLYDQRGVSINIDYHSKSADLESLHLTDPEPLYFAKEDIRGWILHWSRDENIQNK